MIAVKNVARSRAAQTVEGCGILAHEETGQAEDTPHTRALIDAGLLLEMPDQPKRTARSSSREE